MHSDTPSPQTEAPVFYDASSYCAEESIGFLMKRVVLSVVAQADRRLEAHGLTSAQWGPLLRLKNAGPSTVAELSRWLQVDAGAMTRLLDRLEKKGLLKRVRSTSDRRVVQVELTPAGEAAILEVPAVLADVLNGHLVGFSRPEFEALRGSLRRMLDSGEAMRRCADTSAPAGGAPPSPVNRPDIRDHTQDDGRDDVRPAHRPTTA